MAKNEETNIGVTQKLALICDGVQELFPNAKLAFIVEMNQNDFGATKGIFGVEDLITKKFKIDISGTEIIFLSDELLNDETNNF
jgi:hypothetical protein